MTNTCPGLDLVLIKSHDARHWAWAATLPITSLNSAHNARLKLPGHGDGDTELRTCALRMPVEGQAVLHAVVVSSTTECNMLLKLQACW